MKNFSKVLSWSCATILGIALFITIGCGDGKQGGSATSIQSAHAGEHEHPSEGPYHGSLIELGNEEYHAELVHDDAAGTVTIYLLDSTAKTGTPINAKEIQINLSHSGQAEQFTLQASPETGDPVGKASRFFSNDSELAEDLDHEEAQAQLVVSIDGKQFRGAIEHDHDHDEHGH